jgi:hypothetical protein
MITYIVGFAVTLMFFSIGIKSIVKRGRNKKRQLAIATTYDRFVRDFNLAFEYSEFINDRFIGLDKRNGKLLLIDHYKTEKQELCIPLWEIGETKIIHGKDLTHGIKTVVLELASKCGHEPTQFCFFNKELDPVIELPALSRKAINWKTRLDIHKRPDRVNVEAEYVL